MILFEQNVERRLNCLKMFNFSLFLDKILFAQTSVLFILSQTAAGFHSVKLCRSVLG